MNEKGWGLRVELFFIFIFLLCLLIATLGLNKFGLLENKEDTDVFGNPKNTQKYLGYEDDVSRAAYNYYNNKYPSGSSDTIIVSLNTLYNGGYLSVLYDAKGNECSGYAKILSNKNVLPYIKCSNYKTKGYSKNYE